jgi:peptidoglycan hydrolase-like protein with peptidoglycan-binding domain
MTTTFVTLRKGSKGTAVKTLQQRLKTLGYYSSTIDGDFGSKTKAAVIKFQNYEGLVADGIVGAKTWRQLSFILTFDYSPEQIVLNNVFGLS